MTGGSIVVLTEHFYFQLIRQCCKERRKANHC